ncbi:PH domain-containing protein, partial [Lactiplantibacillus plantarum]|uniref:PH domain-containing protein n=1 Tax=Lactiplantibacillus plantarum TaxID=1590 RepID=UPI0012B87425
ITPTAVFLQKSCFCQKKKARTIARIQNVTLEAGPLLQWQELQQVNIETASTAHVIDGVTRPVADQLRNQILQLAQEARNE